MKSFIKIMSFYHKRVLHVRVGRKEHTGTSSTIKWFSHINTLTFRKFNLTLPFGTPQGVLSGPHLYFITLAIQLKTYGHILVSLLRLTNEGGRGRIESQ